MPHPVGLCGLVEQYNNLCTEHARNGTAGAQRELEDLAYTLCVSTGTLTIEAALTAAREQLDTTFTDPPVMHDAARRRTQVTG